MVRKKQDSMHLTDDAPDVGLIYRVPETLIKYPHPELVPGSILATAEAAIYHTAGISMMTRAKGLDVKIEDHPYPNALFDQLVSQSVEFIIAERSVLREQGKRIDFGQKMYGPLYQRHANWVFVRREYVTNILESLAQQDDRRHPLAQYLDQPFNLISDRLLLPRLVDPLARQLILRDARIGIASNGEHKQAVELLCKSALGESDQPCHLVSVSDFMAGNVDIFCGNIFDAWRLARYEQEGLPTYPTLVEPKELGIPNLYGIIALENSSFISALMHHRLLQACWTWVTCWRKHYQQAWGSLHDPRKPEEGLSICHLENVYRTAIITMQELKDGLDNPQLENISSREAWAWSRMLFRHTSYFESPADANRARVSYRLA